MPAVAQQLNGSASIRVILNSTEGDHARADQIDAGMTVHRPLQPVDLPRPLSSTFGHAFPIALCAFVAAIEYDPHRQECSALLTVAQTPMLELGTS
jgi:hypothetical protein